MNPNAPQPSFELPPLPNEVGGQDSQENPEVSIAREQAPAVPQTARPVPMPPSVPLQHPGGIQPVALPGQTSQSGVSAVSLSADDGDLIEKEWVLKAKQIVAATREDPHAQNRELSRIKADYIKKRYGKDVKIDET